MPTPDNYPLVTIIALTYRNFDHLEETFKSISEQDYPSIELIISDDGSEAFPKSRVEALIEAIAMRNCSAIRILQNKTNMGIVAHSNHAARAANGKYIKFISPGDGFRSPSALKQLVSLAEDRSASIVTSPSIVCADSMTAELYQYPRNSAVRALQNQPSAVLFDTVARANVISPIGTLYASSFFSDVGFDELYRYLDDWPTWLSFLRKGGKLPCLSHAVTFYTIGAGVSSRYNTAFQAPLLREDMMHCYEKEIFPYFDMLSPLTKVLANYHYRELRQVPEGADFLKDAPFRLYYGAKRKAKQMLISARAYKRTL